MKDLVLGLDIGITSIGWMLYSPERRKMITMGVRLFNEAGSAQDTRKYRSARRNITHKKWRKEQLLQAIIDFNIVPKEYIYTAEGKLNEQYLSFTYKNLIKDETIYHLRNRAIHEEVTTREMVLALYNICKTRGHFLLDNVDFENNDSISFDIFKSKFFGIVENYVTFNSNKDDFETEILEPIFERKLAKKDIDRLFRLKSYCLDEDDSALIQICYLLSNYSTDLIKIDESIALLNAEGELKTKKIKMNDLKKEESLNPFLEKMVELYDVSYIAEILKKYQYICEKDIALWENVKNVYHLKDIGNPDYNKEAKELQSVMNVSSKHPDRIRSIKTMENKVPNGLYVKEVRAILRNQQKYNPLITNEFIDICIGIIRSRIPYYVGPLGKNAKNGWAEKTGKFKYSYEYSKLNGSIDEGLTIEKWKLQMISRCTYLPDEFALPKGSFIAETFSIINELNNLECVDLDENTHYLTTEEKFKVFDELFLKSKATVNYNDISKLLNLKKCGTRRSGTVQKFKVGYTLYFDIIKLLPKLKVESIKEILQDSKKIEELEQIILDINLFDEEISKKEHFNHYYPEVSEKLSKLKSNGFYAFSRKFICNSCMDEENHSLIEKLFEDNCGLYKNEQMTLITNAKNTHGEPIDYSSNKYETKFRNGEAFGINLLIQEGKPLLPISRPVIRALNECIKLYQCVCDFYGVPKRVVIETAKDFKDVSLMGEVPAKHFDEMKKCYDYIIDQCNSDKKLKQGLDDWDEISKYLNKNKRKIELYIRQNGRDMISGDSILLDHLNEYEIDHILPRGFGDNSMDDLMLIHKNYNAKKSNRVPLVYLEQEIVHTMKDDKVVTVSSYEKRVRELFDMKLISESKLQRLLLKSDKEVEGFINRNLVDTRYIISEFMAILNAYNKEYNHDSHIVALKSAYTTVYKRAFDIRKNRDIGEQHHALDAATLVLADQILSHFYPNYDRRGNFKNYQNFINQMNKTERESVRKLNNWIDSMYTNTFDHRMNDRDSLLNQIKNTTPLYSLKVEKNYTGGLFEATLYSPKDEKKENPLSLLGINNDKRIFSGINCAAVDFYKYTDQKGKKKHIAIHIPKAIIKSNGEINQEMYKQLILNWYKAPELLDDQGNLKTGYFRFRAFKNDLIYNTESNTVMKFNIGSMVNKKIELNHIYDFAYNDIYKDFYRIQHEIVNEFNIKSYNNKNKQAKQFNEVDKDKLISFCTEQFLCIQNQKHVNAVKKILSPINDMNGFLEMLLFVRLIMNRPYTTPQIIERCVSTADSLKTGDGQYVKLKYSPLGIQIINNEGKLTILGPKHHENAVSKIKKENFSWKMSKEML